MACVTELTMKNQEARVEASALISDNMSVRSSKMDQ